MPNKYKHIYGGFDYFQVPCRKCKECQEIQQNDYLVRSIALWNSLPDYSVYFCTLTFNNANLPHCNVYEEVNGTYQYLCTEPCFNHELYKRFRKNFNEYCVDHFQKPLYILCTCEYGEKKHRPHYHCIVFCPFYLPWKQFKKLIERYWHYGFTKNICVAFQDGQFYDRSLINCFKYVVKYVNKYSSRWLPFYLDEDKYSTDLLPCNIKPRVFCSNHYGDSLVNHLQYGHYVNNSVFMQIRGCESDNGKNYHLPQYYRRKYFTESKIIEQYKIPYPLVGKPFEDKIKHKYKIKSKSIVNRLHNYTELLIDKFKSTLRTNIFQCNKLLNNDMFFQRYFVEEFGISQLPNKTYDNIMSVYLETFSPSSPKSLLPYQRKIFEFHKHWLIPPQFHYNDWEKRLFVRTRLQDSRRHELPWPDLPFIKIGICKNVISYYPEEYFYILAYENYTRNLRVLQHQFKDKRDAEWYTHHYYNSFPLSLVS